MARLRYPAKATHTAYGICRYAAIGETFMYAIIVFMIVNKSAIRQMKAARNALKRKNMSVHEKLSIRLRAYIVRALEEPLGVTSFVPYTRAALIPIRI